MSTEHAPKTDSSQNKKSGDSVQTEEEVIQPSAGLNDFQKIMTMQSTIGNHATMQLLRQQEPVRPRPRQNSLPFSGLRIVPPTVQRDPASEALEGIESTAPDAAKPDQGFDAGGKLTPVYAKAWEVAWTQFKPTVESITKRLPGATSSVAPLKGRERAGEKASSDYGGKTESLVDIARASIVCQTIEQVVECYEAAASEFEVVRVKNRFASPAGGYRDLNLNVKLEGGHIAELQIHLQAIIDVKNADGHKIYEDVRKIEAKPEEERSEEEKKQLEEGRAAMQALYNEAWEQAKAIPEQ